ncbi:MAG: outer membrane protein assembly factor BamB [Limnobacter sp.]|nr:outer membrane protein assembly factor BamB [Limnobacter sp.]
MKFVRTLLVCSSVGLAACSSLNPFSGSTLEPAELQSFAPALEIEPLWQLDIGDSEQGAFAPAVRGEFLFAASGEGNLLAIASETGKVIWSREIEGGLSAGVAAGIDTVAVVDQSNTLRAYDFDGNSRWSIQLETDVTTPPLGEAGLILVRSIDYAVSAYSAQSGGLVWRYQRQLPALTLRSEIPVSINNGVIYAGFPGGRVVGLDFESGNLVWEGSLTTPTGTTEIERIADVTGAPIYNFREVCAGSFQGSVGCLDLNSGRTVWSVEFSAPNGASVDDRYVIANNELGDLYAFSRSGGREVWRIETLQRRSPTTPVVMGRAVAVGDYEGYVHFINRDDGATIARIRAGKEPLTSPPLKLSENLMVSQSRDGRLVMLAVQ